MEDLTKKLQSIGLTPNEAKVYIFLIKNQEAKAGQLTKSLNIPSSHIYTILEKLILKGIISFKIFNNTKIYRPVNPESLYTLFKEKEKQIEKEKEELKEFIENLKEIKIEDNKQNDFKYFEGVQGVKSMFNEFLANSKENSEMIILGAPITVDLDAFFLENFHKPRIKNKIPLRIIMHSELKKFGKEREKMKLTKVRYSDLKPETEFGVTNDHIYFLSEGEKPYALLVKDENMAKTQKKIFNVLWENSKE